MMAMTLAILNIVALVCLWCWLVWLIIKRKEDISSEAQELFFRPLLLGLTFWVMVRVALTVASAHANAKGALPYKIWLTAGLLGSAPSELCRFVAGRNLFRLRDRLMHDMQPVMPDPPIWRRLRAFICSRTALIIACVLAISPVIVYTLLMAWYSDKIPVALVNVLTAGSAGYSFLILGAGLTRELTRNRREFVGLFTGLSVVFYGGIQLFAANEDWIPFLNILAFALKGTFAVAIASFWTMSRELARVSEERPTVTVFKTRFLMDIHDVFQAPDEVLKFSDAASTFLAMGNVAEVGRCLGCINKVARKQDGQLKNLLQSLDRGTEVVQKGLCVAIGELAENSSNEPSVLCQATGDESTLSPVQKESFYLVTRESLRNALRHATNVTVVKVTLDCDRKLLIIEDDGCGSGPPAEPQPGHGIDMMRAVARETGFRLIFENRQPHGTRVRLEVQSE